VIEVKDAAEAESGGGVSEGKRQTTKLPASWRNFNGMRVNGFSESQPLAFHHS